MDQPSPKEYLFNEAKIVQRIITRMGHNSFLIKGWAVSLVVVSLLFEGVVYHHFIAFIPWIVFWVLDAYFLQLERLYRLLYDWLIANRLNSNEYLLSMSVERFRGQVPCKLQTMFSKTLLTFYSSLLAIIIAVLIFDFVFAP